MDKQMLDMLKQILEGQQIMQTRLEKIEGEVKGIRSTQEEHGQILRAIDARTQVHSAEIANLQHEVAEIKGDIKGIQKDMARVEEATASNWVDIARIKAAK